MEILLLLLLLVLLAETTYLVVRQTGSHLGNVTRRSQSVYVDTSALMDGRIVTAAQSGFIPHHLVITQSVITELQYLADQADSEKRSRARRGLDAIEELKSLEYVTVKLLEDGPTNEGGVDQRLVDLAKQHHGMLCTIDFNLNKVATAHGIKVLNINELAGSLRMAFLPGETLSIELSAKGQSSQQAVGYLADGTMVVVDKAAAAIGTKVQVEFIRSLQTAAGRMMFAKLSHPVQQTKHQPPKGRKPAGQTGTRKKSSKRVSTGSGEDSLLELVNNQQ